MYLIEDDEKEYRVRDAGRPSEDVRPRREKHRDQAEHRAYKFYVADAVSKDREKYLTDIEECGKRFEHEVENERKSSRKQPWLRRFYAFANAMPSEICNAGAYSM